VALLEEPSLSGAGDGAAELGRIERRGGLIEFIPSREDCEGTADLIGDFAAAAHPNAELAFI
jgi:hypothetical protein